MGLKDYTTEELKAEITRRKREARRLLSMSRSHKAEYAYATATITWVSNDPYIRKRFKGVVNNDSDCGEINSHWLRESELHIIRANFTKDTAPKVGDTVRVKSRKTRRSPYGFSSCFSAPHIVEIIKHKDQ